MMSARPFAVSSTKRTRRSSVFFRFTSALFSSRSTATLTLGTQQFLGQFVSDWNAVLAALTIAIIPMLALYLAFNRQFIRGLMGGALK